MEDPSTDTYDGTCDFNAGHFCGYQFRRSSSFVSAQIVSEDLFNQGLVEESSGEHSRHIHNMIISGFPRAWKIMEFKTIMENQWKSHGFLSFFEKSWKTDISRRKSWNFAQTISSMHDIWLWQSSSLHLQVHYFLSCSLVHNKRSEIVSV